MYEQKKKAVINERYMPTLEVISLAVGFERVKKEKSAKLKYPVYLTKEMEETNIEALELSVRASNCLRRYGYHTIGGLVEKINCGDDLKRLKNCGKASIMEIMLTIMCYQFMQLDTGRQKVYIERLRELN